MIRTFPNQLNYFSLFKSFFNKHDTFIINCLFKKHFQSQKYQRLLRITTQAFRRLPLFPNATPILTPIAFLGFNSQPQKTKMSTEKTNLDDILQNADQLFDQNQYQEALDVLKNCSEQENVNVLWRQARALYKLSGTVKAKKDELIREGFAKIQQALALDDKNYACHKWMSVLLDAKCELDGIKERVSQLENVKKHMQLAIELNPDDPTNWHLLGNFAFGLADMAWYQRKIVSAIFATPPTGTYEEALEYFLKAEEKKPNFYSMNLLFIGKCYKQLKDNEKAKEYLTRAANVQVLNEDDKKCKEEATALLKKL